MIEDSRNDNIGCDQEDTLEIVTSAVQHQEVNNEGGNEKTDGLKEGEVQGHVLVHAPAQDNDQRRDENSY